MPYFDIAIIGGDKRLTYMIPLLRARGYRVISYHTSRQTAKEEEAIRASKEALCMQEAIDCAEGIVLGVPMLRGNELNGAGKLGFKEFIDELKSHQMVFAGAIGVPEKELMLQKTKAIYDFLEEESMAVMNAMATAESFILERMLKSEKLISGEKILLFGFGRCGKNIAIRLKGLQAKVTVATDVSEERTWAKALGFEAVDIMTARKTMGEYEEMVNTIPYPIIGKKDLELLRKKITLYEIASRSCLVDEETSKDTLLQIIYLPGLPGKYKAQSLAEAYTEFVCEKMEGVEAT